MVNSNGVCGQLSSLITVGPGQQGLKVQCLRRLRNKSESFNLFRSPLYSLTRTGRIFVIFFAFFTQLMTCFLQETDMPCTNSSPGTQLFTYFCLKTIAHACYLESKTQKQGKND